MTSLADLFNPTFFIILGIVTLFIALLVVYFESKIRDQNHKIASMLSLVSTLAEDMNDVKMGLNHLAVTSANGGGEQSIPHTMSQDLGLVEEEENSQHLIEVSDDEDESEDESEEESIESSENDDTEDETDDEPVKIIKLNIYENDDEAHEDDVHDVADSYYEANHLEFNPEDHLEALEDMGDIPEMSEEYTEDILRLKYDEAKNDTSLVERNFLVEETTVPSSSELKTISINLGEDAQSEHIEYKKLQLTKLRSIAVEKGLATSSDVQKLKKPEILMRLMGVE